MCANHEPCRGCECVEQGLAGAENPSVLDVAVGHGMYGIELARRHKDLSVTALGPPDVLQKVKLSRKVQAPWSQRQ